MSTPLVEQIKQVATQTGPPPTVEQQPSQTSEATLWGRLPRPLSGATSFAAAAALTVLATGVGATLSQSLPLHSVALVYLLAVVVSAVVLGMRTGLAVAGLAFLAYNFFFIPPIYTLTIADPSEVFALFIFLAVAVLTGSLAGRMRDVANAAERRATALHAQSEFAQVLTAAHDETAILDALTKQTAAVTQGDTVILIRTDEELRIQSTSRHAVSLSSSDLQSAHRAIRTQTIVPPVAIGWPGARFEFWPIKLPRGVTGTLGFASNQQRQNTDADIVASVQASVKHATIALERTRLLNEAEAARSEMERERLRTALLSSLSHDLRTPLASILGSVTSLRQLGGALDEATRADLLVAIEEEAGRLSRFVTNLLDMTRLESATIDLKSDWLDIGDVVLTAVARARRIAPERKINLTSAVLVPSVRGDATLFEHVIFNLLDNALKFSTTHDDVDVTVSIVDNSVRATITDHGRGIPIDALGKVFMPFYRVRSGDGDVAGTGLGLAIGKRVIEGMGGTLAIASPTQKGQGTTVTVTVPIAETSAHPSSVDEEAVK